MTRPGRPASPLRTPSSYTDQIAELLREEILAGGYRRDEHLQQDEVCRRFGVSRTPAREALRKLQAMGLVELVPNRGARVRLPTLQELGEVYEVRAELEGFAAELAARHRDDESLAALKEAQRRLAAIVATVPAAAAEPEDSETSEQLRRFNDAFHETVHAAGGNRRLGRSIQELQRYFPKDVVRLAAQSPDALHRLYLDAHGAVLDEIAAGRPARARDAMCTHIRQTKRLLLEFLTERGFGE